MKIKEKYLKISKDGHGYSQVNLSKNGKNQVTKIHKLVAVNFMHHNPNGYKLVIDHVNNIRSDNRLCNIQLITSRKNSSKDKKGSSKYTGVSWDRSARKWKTSIMIKGVNKNLGLFSNEREASLRYQNILKKHENRVN